MGWRWVEGFFTLLLLVSVSSRGIAGNWPFGCDKVGTAGSNVPPRSGFSVLRYRSHQLVSTLSCRRFVSRFPILAVLTPFATLPRNVANALRLTGAAPKTCDRYALRNVMWLNSSSVLSWIYWGMSPSRTCSAAV